MSTLTIAELANRMECCPAWARKVVLRIARENPGMTIIKRPTGNPSGRIVVNESVLALIHSSGTAAALDGLVERVCMVESDMLTIRARLARVENKARARKTCQFATMGG